MTKMSQRCLMCKRWWWWWQKTKKQTRVAKKSPRLQLLQQQLCSALPPPPSWRTVELSWIIGTFKNRWMFFRCVTFLPQPHPSCLSFLAASHQNNFPIILQNLITVQARKESDNKKLDLDISPEKEGHHRSVAPLVEVWCNSNCERWHQRRQFRPNIPHGRSIPAATQIAYNTSPKSWMRWCFGLSLQCW